MTSLDHSGDYVESCDGLHRLVSQVGAINTSLTAISRGVELKEGL
jgi:hypothetical protein